MYRVLNTKRKIILIICIVLTIILMGLWIFRSSSVNSAAFRQEVQHYSTGDNVELDGNFFFDGKENTNGYSIRVNSAEIKDYKEFLKSYGKKDEDLYDIKYVCLLNITVKNEGNDTGYLSAMGFALYNGAVQLPLDFEIWNLIDESIDGNMVLKLRKDSEVTLTLPFTAQVSDEEVNSDKLNHRIENDTFEFVVSDFPIRKLIEVKFQS